MTLYNPEQIPAGTNICQETIQALFMAYDIDGNGYIDQGAQDSL